MSTLYTLAESNTRKTWIYLGCFIGLIIFLGWFIADYFQNPGILIFAFLGSAVTSISSFWFSDKIVLAMSNAKPIEKKDSPELFRLVENLCITAGLPLPKIYIINSPALNAFATGRDFEHSVIAITTGLIEKLERVELEGVIAHELSHIGNKDTLLATVIVVLVGLVALISDMSFRMGFRGKKRDQEKASPIFAIAGIVLLILAPIFARLIKLAISRKREFLADANGALLTRHPNALANALAKISGSPDELRSANNAFAHLFIINPFKGAQAQTRLTRLFSTHPPVEQRIKALKGMKI